MKVSIVIPVYNAEKYLSECIESCLNQTHKDIEIIIVDDGSTDNSNAIIMKYYHQYPNQIRTFFKDNGGTGSALNVGIKNMTGQWFKWLSADDVLLPDAIETMLLIVRTFSDMESYKYLWYTDYEIINESGHHIDLFKEPRRTDLYKEQLDVHLYNNFFGNGSTSLMHKSAIDIVGLFKEGLPYNEDYEYWLRWCFKFGFEMKHMPIVTLKYRQHSNQLTETKDKTDNKILVEKILLQYYKYFTPYQKSYLKKIRPNIISKYTSKIKRRLR